MAANRWVNVWLFLKSSLGGFSAYFAWIVVEVEILFRIDL